MRLENLGQKVSELANELTVESMKKENRVNLEEKISGKIGKRESPPAKRKE